MKNQVALSPVTQILLPRDHDLHGLLLLLIEDFMQLDRINHFLFAMEPTVRYW